MRVTARGLDHKCHTVLPGADNALFLGLPARLFCTVPPEKNRLCLAAFADSASAPGVHPSQHTAMLLSNCRQQHRTLRGSFAAAQPWRRYAGSGRAARLPEAMLTVSQSQASLAGPKQIVNSGNRASDVLLRTKYLPFASHSTFFLVKANAKDMIPLAWTEGVCSPSQEHDDKLPNRAARSHPGQRRQASLLEQVQ